MPLVLAEGGIAGAPESGTVRPRRHRRPTTLPLLCAGLALLMVVPLVPLIRPVKVQAYGHVAVVGTTVLSSSGGMPVAQGYSALSAPPVSETEDFEGVKYVMVGPSHVYLVRVKDWVYYLGWFRGHRL